jgi:glycosyltransferase involved in cell wall biosynthesis
LKILQILNQFLPSQTAGTEVYTWALSKELQKIGHEVKIVIPHFGSRIPSSYTYDGISVHQYSEPSLVDRKLIMGFREPDGLVNFLNFLKTEKPDIVQFHELSGSNGIGLYHVLAAKEAGFKVLMTFHLAGYSCITGTLIDSNRKPCDGKIRIKNCSLCILNQKELGPTTKLLYGFSKALYKLNIDSTKWQNTLGTALGTVQIIHNHENKIRLLIEACDHIICLTNWFHNVLLINGFNSRKITKIEQGIPFQKDTLQCKVSSSVTPIKLMFLGRISPVKGLHLLVEALLTLNPDEIELNIFGHSDGTSYEDDLKKQTSKMPNIHWRGVLAQQEVQRIMSNHDLLCLCSTVCEMSPLVIQEAKAVGLPVLASDVYGNSEQLDNGSGLLFEINSVSSLKAQLEKLLTNRGILDQLKQNITAPKKFNVIATEYDAVYKRILNI